MDISRITDQLYIAALPKADDATAIESLGVRLVINMLHLPAARVYSRPPFRELRLRTFDSPWVPIAVRKLVRGVEAALPVLREGHGVLVYCRAGMHRSAAMASCILIAMGHTAEEAMGLVCERRAVADPHVPYIEQRILRFGQHWARSAAMEE